MNGSRWVFAIIAMPLLGVACSNDVAGGGTQAGSLTLRLTTPHADDGAMTFQVSGPAIESANAANGSLRLFTRQASGSTMVGAVVGALADGAVITLRVPDVGAAGSYAATVLEVADRQDALRTSLTGYALTVTR